MKQRKLLRVKSSGCFLVALLFANTLCQHAGSSGTEQNPASGTISQQRSGASQRDVFKVTHDFIEGAYPELFGKDLYVQLSLGRPIDSSWDQIYGVRYTITRFGPTPSFNPYRSDSSGKPIPPPENTIFLNGTIWFDGQGQILQAWFSHDEAYFKPYKAFQKAANAHPEWTDEKLIRELEQAGARYGPQDKSSFEKAVRLDKLDNALGHLKLKSIEFLAVTSPDHVGTFAQFYWTIRADSKTPNGSTAEYVLDFEPFAGRLMSVVRMPDRAAPIK